MKIDVTITVNKSDKSLATKMDALQLSITNLRNEVLSKMNADTQAILDQIDAASTDLAGDLQRLIDAANQAGSLTAEEINTALAPRVAFLQQLAHVSDAPVPEAPAPLNVEV